MLATWLYRNAIRPCLFLLDPEEAHDLVANLLPVSAPLLGIGKEIIFSPQVQAALPRLATTLAGAALGTAVLFAGYLTGAARNPEESENLFNTTLMAFALIETFVFLSLV